MTIKVAFTGCLLKILDNMCKYMFIKKKYLTIVYHSGHVKKTMKKVKKAEKHFCHLILFIENIEIEAVSVFLGDSLNIKR